MDKRKEKKERKGVEEIGEKMKEDKRRRLERSL